MDKDKSRTEITMTKEDLKVKVGYCPFCGKKLDPKKKDGTINHCDNPHCITVTSINHLGQPDPLWGNRRTEDEQVPVKIPIKLDVSVKLASVGFDGVSRSYPMDYEGDWPPPDSVNIEGFEHGYTILDFSIEVPQRLMDMLNEETFLEIEVEGRKDFLTDDASEETKGIAWRS